MQSVTFKRASSSVSINTEIIRKPDVLFSWGYKKRPVAWNGLKRSARHRLSPWAFCQELLKMTLEKKHGKRNNKFTCNRSSNISVETYILRRTEYLSSQCSTVPQFLIHPLKIERSNSMVRTLYPNYSYTLCFDYLYRLDIF